MKNSVIFIIGIFVLIVGGFFVLGNGKSSTESVVSNPNIVQGEVQKVVLSQVGVNYKDSKAQTGKPILISADSSVRGCLRSVTFNIEGKRYSKYLRTSEDSLQLPSLKKGTYTFSCSMGMGYGKLIVG